MAGNTSQLSATRTVNVDDLPPETTVLTATTGTASSFAFSSDKASSTFQCRLDGPGATTGSYVTCSSPAGFSMVRA